VTVINSKNNFTRNVIKELNNSNIKLDITAVYAVKQTEKILKVINKKTKVILSIFGVDPETVEKIQCQNL
jgi:transaldolase